jgi:hypothetical protein
VADTPWTGGWSLRRTLRTRWAPMRTFGSVGAYNIGHLSYFERLSSCGILAPADLLSLCFGGQGDRSELESPLPLMEPHRARFTARGNRRPLRIGKYLDSHFGPAVSSGLLHLDSAHTMGDPGVLTQPEGALQTSMRQATEASFAHATTFTLQRI